jgi:LPXTG-site transpeptidase (sortase) family protein
MHKKSQVKFIIYFVSTFMVLFVLLYSAGFVPSSIKSNNNDSLRVLWDKAQKNNDNSQGPDLVVTENPTRIVINNIGVDVSVSNPNTTDIKTLDQYLLEGAVHYPGSGFLGLGNMFIFAHSAEAYVILNNKNLKAFDKLQTLKEGDTIEVYGSSGVYIYAVSSVSLVDENKALVEFDNQRNMLTLSTCNTFGAKSDRYVVEADYIGLK